MLWKCLKKLREFKKIVFNSWKILKTFEDIFGKMFEKDL